jgi:hypothetical protein
VRCLLTVCLGLMALAQPALAQDASRVDSVVIERVARRVPNRIPLTKRRALTQHPQLDSALSRLRNSGLGLFESATTPACRSEGENVSAVIVTVFGEAKQQRMTIPDDCVGASESVATTVKDLQHIAWRMIGQGA